MSHLATPARDLYLKITPKKGEPFIRCHRVWDAERLLASITKHETKEGNKVEVSTRDAYMDQLKTRRA